MSGNEQDMLHYFTITDKNWTEMSKLHHPDNTFVLGDKVSRDYQFDIQNNEDDISEVDESFKTFVEHHGVDYSALDHDPTSLLYEDFLSSKSPADAMDWSENESMKVNCLSNPQHNEKFGNLNDPKLAHGSELPKELAIPTTQNESDFSRPKSCNINLFHLVDVVYPVRTLFAMRGADFEHEFDSRGKEQTRIHLKIPCCENVSMLDHFYKHLLAIRDGCKNCLVTLFN